MVSSLKDKVFLWGRAPCIKGRAGFLLVIAGVLLRGRAPCIKDRVLLRGRAPCISGRRGVFPLKDRGPPQGHSSFY